MGVYLWGKLSDTYGRKWITLGGVASASIACALFGFGRTFDQLLCLRLTMGFLNSAQAAYVPFRCQRQ